MKKSILLYTNITICIILVIGFLSTALLGYQANYQDKMDHIEQISFLSSEGMYYQMHSLFTKPVNISVTMANDYFLENYLANEKEQMENDDVREICSYLRMYKEKYRYDSVFLVSEQTRRYYNDAGVDRVLALDNPENNWYKKIKDGKDEYFLVIDNDEVQGAEDALTIFVNCKILNEKGEFIGAVGVGLRVDELQQLLVDYEYMYDIEAMLIDRDGGIQVSAAHTGYENINLYQQKEYLFYENHMRALQDGPNPVLKFWADTPSRKNYFVVAQMIPDLDWILVVEKNTESMMNEMNRHIFYIVLIVGLIIILILWVVTKIIKIFNRKIIDLQNKNEEHFRRATEKLYDNIYELNITKNCCVGESTQRYFNSLGVSEDIPFDKALNVIAQKQIKEEFQDGYVATFTPRNVQAQFQQGVSHLRYEFMVCEDGVHYQWMRIDARLFLDEEDNSLHMLTYRQNIEEEKKLYLKMQCDEMTGLYSKATTEKMIRDRLNNRNSASWAFVIFDIDNFKNANDTYGHAFGDEVIKAFAQLLKTSMDTNSIVGRIGGDEFVAFFPFNMVLELELQIEQLSSVLDYDDVHGKDTWHVSSSIGIAIYPDDANDYTQLYQKADSALYETKKNGKSGATFYSWKKHKKLSNHNKIEE